MIARRVYAAARGFDPVDAYSIPAGQFAPRGQARARGFTRGLPRPTQLSFFGDAQYARLFEETVDQLEALGAKPVEIDFEPFLATARLL